MKKLKFILTCLLLYLLAFAFQYNLETSKVDATIAYWSGSEINTDTGYWAGQEWSNLGYWAGQELSGGCADCSGTATLIWEMNSLTVGDTGYSPCGCSDGDTSVTNQDASISNGVASYDDSSESNGWDRHELTVSSDDLIDDSKYTIFLRCQVQTYVSGMELFEAYGDGSNLINIYISGDPFESVYFRHNTSVGTDGLVTAGHSTDIINQEIIIRARSEIDRATTDIQVSVYETDNTLIANTAQEDNHDLLNTDPTVLATGNRGSTAGSDFDCEYVHVYNDWLTNDPNGTCCGE